MTEGPPKWICHLMKIVEDKSDHRIVVLSYTAHSSTTLVVISEILMEWNYFIVPHDKSLQTIRVFWFLSHSIECWIAMQLTLVHWKDVIYDIDMIMTCNVFNISLPSCMAIQVWPIIPHHYMPNLWQIVIFRKFYREILVHSLVTSSSNFLSHDACSVFHKKRPTIRS